MKDTDRTKEQLLSELEQMRQQVKELEASEACGYNRQTRNSEIGK